MPSFLERILLLPSALLAATLSQALGAAVVGRDTQKSTTMPAPISFSLDQNWDGIDGSWSTFSLQIGTPPQTVHTLLSWASYQTWAVLPAGCNTSANYDACAEDRGGIFDQAKSKSWEDVGIYDLYIEDNLGYTGNAIYGYDVVTLGNPVEGGPTLDNTTVGGMAWDDFYLGLFGVNPKPTNFTSMSDGSPSFMTQLKEQDYIPSVSFGYSAGAQYRFNGELASLTLGGYDTSKFIPNGVEFDFAPDNSRDIVVGLQSIYTPSQIESSPVPTELLPYAIYAYLDSTVAEFWLPLDACQVFEYEFGLTYDNFTQLYLLNDTLHQQLLDRNATITFQLGTSLDGDDTVTVELPYASFDLTAKPPYQYVNESSYYFPLRRAMNASQYTIGRTFFQEAYISVDYETQKFNVSQRAWDQNAVEHLVAIQPGPTDSAPAYLNPSASKSSSSGGLSGGAIAGIAVGTVAAIVLIALAILMCWRRRRMSVKKAAQHEKLGSDSGSTNNTAVASPGGNGPEGPAVYPKAELAGSPVATRNETPEPVLSSGGLGSSASNSGSGNGTPTRSPHHLSGSTYLGRILSYADSPTGSLAEGEGTHSSSDSDGNHTSNSGNRVSSNSNGNTSSRSSGALGHMSGLVSPISPIGESSDSANTPPQRTVHEMVGDMPTIKEKDGHEMSEKEAIAHRERVYNGVDSPPSSAYPSSEEPLQEPMKAPPKRVNPEEVARGDVAVDTDQWPLRPPEYRQHRAFSFEEERSNSFFHTESSEDDMYS